MPALMSKINADSLTQLLEKDRLVHVSCERMAQLTPIAAEVATWFVNTRERMPVSGRPNWRAFVVSPHFEVARRVVNLATEGITVSGLRRWYSATDGRSGSLRALVADPVAVQGIAGWNLLYILLNVHDKHVWQLINNSIVADTRILAVNSELFAQWNDFTHLSWGEYGYGDI